MVSYRGDLPSLHLAPDDLMKLEDILERHLSSSEISVKVGSKGFTRRYKNVDEMLDDSTLPPRIYDFELSLSGNEGECTIRGNSTGMTPTLNDVSISGEEDWVKTKKSDLDEFFTHKQNRIRTIFEKMRYVFPISLLLAGISSIPALLINGVGSFYLFLLITFNIYWMEGLFGINFLYPYSIIFTERGVTYRPYLKKIVSWLFGIVAVVAGVLTIINYI